MPRSRSLHRLRQTCKTRRNRNPSLLIRKAGAEFAGTFFITIVAIGVDVDYYTGGGVDYVSRWLARGFITTAMIYAFSELSGAHADPAVSLAFALRKAMPPLQMLLYWVAQFAGGFAAAALAFALWKKTMLLGASHPGPRYTQLEAALAEVMLTFLLVFVILATAEEESKVGKQAALAVGLTVAACGLFAGPISGASMNPARSIAAQLIGGAPELVWIYAAGPSVGAALAAAAAFLFFPRTGAGEQRAGKGKE
ncbi:MAG TPA: aquaporin [Candidatus Cybelea sp.]|jgi:aquaporin Z